MESNSVGISGVGSYVPEKIITNFDLSKMVETSNEWIVERTGIEERRVVEGDMVTSDMATIAAEKALKDANLKAEDIDLIIVATITSDYALPSTACVVQKKLGAKKAAAFDLNAGCSGFVYGMVTGSNFIKSGAYEKVLVIGAESLSKIVNWEDRNTCILFGDGAGACVLEKCEDGYGIMAFELGSDGSKGDVLIQPAGGAKMPASRETVDKKLHTMQMNGKEVFKFAVRVIEKTSMSVLEKAKLKKEELDYLIPHQANIRIIDSARKKLGLNKENVYVNLNKYGNMSAASIPVALDEALKENKIKKGDKILFVGFGSGLTWASMVVNWNKGGN